MQIAKHTVASIEYTLKDDAGAVIDTSEGHGPLAYVHGVGALVPGLENELEGKGEGDEVQVRVDPEQGYGPRHENMVQDVPRSELPSDGPTPEVGMQFQAQGQGGPMILTVVGVEEDSVRLDANHPLAGVHLNFDVKIVEVRTATPEEIEHGHVHGPGEHQH